MCTPFTPYDWHRLMAMTNDEIGRWRLLPEAHQDLIRIRQLEQLAMKCHANAVATLNSEPVEPITGRRIAALLSAELERNGYGDVDPYWIKLAAKRGEDGDVQDGNEIEALRVIFGNVATALGAQSTPTVPPPTAHDEGAAPPPGFVRYRIEMDLPEDVDPSVLLEEAQNIASNYLDESETEDYAPSEDLYTTIDNRVSVQRMEG